MIEFPIRPWAAMLLILAVAALPIVITDAYFRSILVICIIYALFAVSLDLIVGFIGVYSFGHAAFLGVGAYTSGILVTKVGLPYLVTIPAAMVIAGLLGLVFSLPALRMRGVYFAITTLACAEIVKLVATNWSSLTDGSMGLPITVNHFGPIEVPDIRVALYYLGLAGLTLACFFLARLVNSPIGRGLIAIRENEALAATNGIPVFLVKSILFSVSAALAGLAGAIYAPFVGIIGPDLLSVNYSALGLLMVVVGGQGTIIGPIIGALLFTVVAEFFRFADELRMVAFSALLIVSIIAMPRGIVAPFLDRMNRYYRSKARNRATVKEAAE